MSPDRCFYHIARQIGLERVDPAAHKFQKRGPLTSLLPLDVAHVDTPWQLNHCGRFARPARRDNCAHVPLPPATPSLRRCGAARATNPPCVGPCRRDLARRPVSLHRRRRRHRGRRDDRGHPAHPPGAVQDRACRTPQRHGRARPVPHPAGPQHRRSGARPVGSRRRPLPAAPRRRPHRGERPLRRPHVTKR